MTQPIHLIAETYVFDIPEGATGFFFDGRMSIGFYYEGELRFAHLPGPGNWQIICTTKEITEEVAKTIAQPWAANKPGTFRNHLWPAGPDFCTSALESVCTLCASKKMDSNKNYIIIKKVS